MMLRAIQIGLAVVTIGALLMGAKEMGVGAARKDPIPAPVLDEQVSRLDGHGAREVAVFAGGCFWGVQTVFQRVKGVQQTVAGYSGGSAKTATYKQVVTETTGHAESVEITYDPSLITYGQLLRVYF